jgi:hypothetical protein
LGKSARSIAPSRAKSAIWAIVQYEGLLRRLRALGLVDTIDGRNIDVKDTDARLRLRGSVRMILPIQTVDEMAAWVRKYRSGRRKNHEEIAGKENL